MEINLQNHEVQFALKVARAGAQIAARVSAAGSIRSLTKEDHSPVTLVDMGIQAVAGAFWEPYVSSVPLVAEETAEILKRPERRTDLETVVGLVKGFCPDATPQKIFDWIDSGKGAPEKTFWVLDPIDGTKGFLRGGQYVTALALIREGVPELAVLGCPQLKATEKRGGSRGVLILAVRGKGCWGTSLACESDPWFPLRVSNCRDLSRARILESAEPSHRHAEEGSSFRKKMGIIPEPIPLDSQAKHAVLAMGEAEIFYRLLSRRDPSRREKIWDVAPGSLVIEEAGGCVTDLEGKPLDYRCGITLSKNPGFLATNGSLHREVLQALSGAVS